MSSHKRGTQAWEAVACTRRTTQSQNMHESMGVECGQPTCFQLIELKEIPAACDMGPAIVRLLFGRSLTISFGRTTGVDSIELTLPELCFGILEQRATPALNMGCMLEPLCQIKMGCMPCVCHTVPKSLPYRRVCLACTHHRHAQRFEADKCNTFVQNETTSISALLHCNCYLADL